MQEKVSAGRNTGLGRKRCESRVESGFDHGVATNTQHTKKAICDGYGIEKASVQDCQG